MNATDIRDTADFGNPRWREQYDEFLDKVFEKVKIGTLTYPPSLALRGVDHTAYLCGFADWLDGISDPWQCGDCESRHETEEEAEACCQE